jgi:ketosteroid isomerase-like protein
LAEIGEGFHDDFEFVAVVPGEPVTGRGFREYRRRFTDWLEPWVSYTPNIEEIIDLDDRVVVIGQDRGRMRGMDAAVDSPKGVVVYRFTDGKVSRIEYYFDRRAGLEAAGLSE